MAPSSSLKSANSAASRSLAPTRPVRSDGKGPNMLTMTLSRITDYKGDDWGTGSRHWRVTLSRIDEKRKSVARMTVPYHQGSGHTKTPTLADVLTALRMDASVPDTFKGFCGEFGYDADSRKAEKIWKACQSVKIRMRKLLGNDGVYLELDGSPVQAGHPNMLLGWMHRHHSFSWSHALQHEGYSIEVPS